MMHPGLTQDDETLYEATFYEDADDDDSVYTSAGRMRYPDVLRYRHEAAGDPHTYRVVHQPYHRSESPLSPAPPLPLAPMQPYKRGPLLDRAVDQTPLPPPLQLRPRSKKCIQSIELPVTKRKPKSSPPSIDYWRWSAIAFATFGAAAFIPAWIYNSICVVHLPGGVLNGTPIGATEASVGFHSSHDYAFNAMPNTFWYTRSLTGWGKLAQGSFIVGGALGLLGAIFKLSGARGRRFGGDLFGSMQWWAFNDQTPPLGSMYWQVWWFLALSMPAFAIEALFIYIHVTTLEVAHARLSSGVSPGVSLIAVGSGCFSLLVACGLSARHAILVSRLLPPVTPLKASEDPSEQTSDVVSTLPPYTTHYTEPQSNFSHSWHGVSCGEPPWASSQYH